MRSYDCRTSSETVHRARSDHCEPRPTLLRPAAVGRHCLFIKGWPDLAWPSSLRVSRLVESWRNTNSLSSAASTADVWCTQFMALAQIQMIAVRHCIFCIDFMPVFYLLSSFFGCVTTLQFIRTSCGRIVAVQSCDPIVKAA